MISLTYKVSHTCFKADANVAKCLFFRRSIMVIFSKFIFTNLEKSIHKHTQINGTHTIFYYVLLLSDTTHLNSPLPHLPSNILFPRFRPDLTILATSGLDYCCLWYDLSDDKVYFHPPVCSAPSVIWAPINSMAAISAMLMIPDCSACTAQLADDALVLMTRVSADVCGCM